MPRETNQSERNPIVTGDPVDDDVVDTTDEEDDEAFEDDEDDESEDDADDDEPVRDATAEVGSEGGSPGEQLERVRPRSAPPTGSEATETWKAQPIYQPQVAEERPGGYTVIKPAP